MATEAVGAALRPSVGGIPRNRWPGADDTVRDVSGDDVAQVLLYSADEDAQRLHQLLVLGLVVG